MTRRVMCDACNEEILGPVVYFSGLDYHIDCYDDKRIDEKKIGECHICGAKLDNVESSREMHYKLHHIERESDTHRTTRMKKEKEAK